MGSRVRKPLSLPASQPACSRACEPAVASMLRCPHAYLYAGYVCKREFWGNHTRAYTQGWRNSVSLHACGRLDSRACVTGASLAYLRAKGGLAGKLGGILRACVHASEGAVFSLPPTETPGAWARELEKHEELCQSQPHACVPASQRASQRVLRACVPAYNKRRVFMYVKSSARARRCPLARICALLARSPASGWKSLTRAGAWAYNAPPYAYEGTFS